MLEAAARARELLADGDMGGSTMWLRIGDAIERLQAMAPAEGEKVQTYAPSAGPAWGSGR